MSFAAFADWTLTVADLTLEFATAQLNLLVSNFGISLDIVSIVIGKLEIILARLPVIEVINVFSLQIESYLLSFTELASYQSEIEQALANFSDFSGDLSIQAQLEAFFQLQFSAEIFAIIQSVAFGATFVGLVFIIEILIEFQLWFKILQTFIKVLKFKRTRQSVLKIKRKKFKINVISEIVLKKLTSI